MVAAETEAVSAVKTLQGEPSPAPAKIGLYSFSQGVSRTSTISVSRASKVYRSLLYAVIVFISFFLMLVFMTYNVRSNAHPNYGVPLLMMPIISYYRRT